MSAPTAAQYAKLLAENERLRLGMTGDYDLDAWLDWTREKDALIARTDAVYAQSVRLRDSIRVALAHVDSASYTLRRRYPGTAKSLSDARVALTIPNA